MITTSAILSRNSRRKTKKRRIVPKPRLGLKSCSFLWLLTSATVAFTAPPLTESRTIDFSQDPAWDGYRNRLLPVTLPVTRQDFGYRPESMKESRTPGRIGGRIQRSVVPAWYAKVIERKSLRQKLSASGRFAVSDDESNTGVLVGWFNQNSRGWRTPNSLVFRIDGNGGKFWIFFEYGTRSWLTGGKGCFEGERYQETVTKPFPANGAMHEWMMVYDPAEANGHGRITLTLDGRDWTLPLAEGHQDDGATFDRFGIFNQQISGGGMTVYFSDLALDGEAIDLSHDPHWDARGNEVQFDERVMRPFHDLGYSKTALCDGAPGEIGGIIWRDERPCYYGAPLEQLTLSNALAASGKLVMKAAGSDSAVYLGWFNAASKINKISPDHVAPQTNILAILIEGPSRIGHYFRPVYKLASGAGGDLSSGPILQPDGVVHDWSVRYLPDGAGGLGEIEFALDGAKGTLPLKPGEKQQGARFDRFGLFNLQSGGHMVEIYLDQLRFTGGRN